MRSRALAAAVAVFAVCGLAGLARSEIADDCLNGDWPRRVTGCTAIIENPATPPGDLAQAFALRALALSVQGIYDRAIGDYDEAIKLVPDFAVALNNRAWAYFKWGRGTRGLPDVERSLELNPLSEHTWDTRAHIRQTMGNHTGAFQDYEQAANIGGERMIKLYQCGLSANGLYKGRLDGYYTDELRSALRTCANSKTCDPLPADEECRDPTS